MPIIARCPALSQICYYPSLVDNQKWHFAAEIYQSYLYCAGKLIRNEGGTIVAYDGDRVMAVFVGDSQSTNAVRCALRINHAVKNIINPAIENQYPGSTYQVRQVVGIDTSKIRAVRTGVRGGNDIVWVGRAANHAAKLTELNSEFGTWITGEVFDIMNKSAKYSNGEEKLMWKEWKWSQM